MVHIEQNHRVNVILTFQMILSYSFTLCVGNHELARQSSIILYLSS